MSLQVDPSLNPRAAQPGWILCTERLFVSTHGDLSHLWDEEHVLGARARLATARTLGTPGGGGGTKVRRDAMSAVAYWLCQLG